MSREEELAREAAYWRKQALKVADVELEQLRKRHEAMKAAGDAKAKLEHVVTARSRGKRRQGEATRELVLALEAEGKSITQTAAITGLSVSTIARYRGAAKR